MACTRGLHADAGPRGAPGRYDVLLHGHLLGDLASHEAPLPHDVSARVSLNLSSEELCTFHFPPDSTED